MAKGVTTEWFDIHVKLGNYLPLERKKSNDEIMAETIKTGESISKKELRPTEIDDDDEELDEFEKQIISKRKAEILENSKKAKFGSLYHVSKEDYIREITEASKNSTVLVHLCESQYNIK